MSQVKDRKWVFFRLPFTSSSIMNHKSNKRIERATLESLNKVAEYLPRTDGKLIITDDASILAIKCSPRKTAILQDILQPAQLIERDSLPQEALGIESRPGRFTERLTLLEFDPDESPWTFIPLKNVVAITDFIFDKNFFPLHTIYTSHNTAKGLEESITMLEEVCMDHGIRFTNKKPLMRPKISQPLETISAGASVTQSAMGNPQSILLGETTFGVMKNAFYDHTAIGENCHMSATLITGDTGQGKTYLTRLLSRKIVIQGDRIITAGDAETYQGFTNIISDLTEKSSTRIDLIRLDTLEEGSLSPFSLTTDEDEQEEMVISIFAAMLGRSLSDAESKGVIRGVQALDLSQNKPSLIKVAQHMSKAKSEEIATIGRRLTALTSTPYVKAFCGTSSRLTYSYRTHVFMVYPKTHTPVDTTNTTILLALFFKHAHAHAGKTERRDTIVFDNILSADGSPETKFLLQEVEKVLDTPQDHTSVIFSQPTSTTATGILPLSKFSSLLFLPHRDQKMFMSLVDTESPIIVESVLQNLDRGCALYKEATGRVERIRIHNVAKVGSSFLGHR
jgi:AAA-like domain